MIYVINNKNKPNDIPSNACVYIGRGRGGVPGNFGNPFIIGRDGTRDEVIEKFRIYFIERLQNDISVKMAFDNLVNCASVGDLYLICWCSPLACHGDIIKELILTELTKRVE